MNITDMIGELYPDLKEKMESEQYRLSEILLSHRMKLNIDQQDMANRMGIQLESYLKLEYADVSIPVETYQLALDSLSLSKDEQEAHTESATEKETAQ